MINGRLEPGEKRVTFGTLVNWGLVIPEACTITIRPYAFDKDVNPLDFARGVYTAHDHDDFLKGRLAFIEVEASVYDAQGHLLGRDEFCGVEWRKTAKQLSFAEADVEELMTEEERKGLVTNAIYLAIQEGGL